MADRGGGFVCVSQASNRHLPSLSGKHLPRLARVDKSVRKRMNT